MRVRALLTKYREPVLYLIFGGLTTAVDFVVFALLIAWFPNISSAMPASAAWVAAVLFAYWTNRLWVFENRASGKEAVRREMVAFFGARGLTGLLSVAIIWLAVDVYGMDAMLVKAFSVVLVIVLNYLLSKFWIFKKES